MQNNKNISHIFSGYSTIHNHAHVITSYTSVELLLKNRYASLVWAFLTLLIQACSPGEYNLIISEVSYEKRPHLKISTEQLEYYYDMKGGGFSRIIDNEGNDWINFKTDPWGIYPASAASSFRGMPNLVFGQGDDGAGHPGHEKCTSRLEENKIITESLSGLWKWSWEFFNDHAILKILKTDPERKYWFLYEGTPGGSFQPEQSFFGTSSRGPCPGGYDYFNGDILWDNFQWMYVGTARAKACLYMVQVQNDSQKDMISFLGNSEAGLESKDGMTVIGFGRDEGAKPLISGPEEFIIGIYNKLDQPEETHMSISKFIEKNYLN